MIEFQCKRMNARTKTPILSDIEIESIAEELLLDYKPSLLEQPGKINALHFIESYLDAEVDYQDIYYPEGDAAILGATAFMESNIRVFDREGKRTVKKKVQRRTIILDNSIMGAGKSGLQLFTALHEGGHLYLHHAVYCRPPEQLMLFDPNANELPQVVCCRRKSIEGYGCRKGAQKWTEEDFREHQANVFAASMAMPRKTFVRNMPAWNAGNGISRNGIRVFACRWINRYFTLAYGFKQNSAYSGMLLMLFSKPKFLADTRMA